MVNPNEKGGEFERKICQILSLWLSENKRDDLFWRAAMSGGRATLRSRQGRGHDRYQRRGHHAGDISSTSREGNDLLDVFFIECKHYKDLQVSSWIYGNQGVLPDIWDTPLAQAKEHGKTVMTIVKQNRKPELILTTLEGSQYLQMACAATLPIRASFVRENELVFVLLLQDLLVRGKWALLRQYFDDEGMLKKTLERRPLPRSRF